MTINDRVRVTADLWCKGFVGTIITVDVSFGFLRYGVRPDPDCAKVAVLWFREGEIEKVE
jgi:hypothetical protein